VEGGVGAGKRREKVKDKERNLPDTKISPPTNLKVYQSSDTEKEANHVYASSTC